MEKSCETCGKTFSIKPSLAAERRHCSAECRHKANRVELTCKGCGKTWWTWKSQLKIPGRPGVGQFCSRECVRLAKLKVTPAKPAKVLREPLFKVCEVCDETFRITPNRQQTARFCSYKCKGQSEAYRAECSDKQRGDKAWRWAGGRYKKGEGYIRLKGNLNGVEFYRFEHTQVMIDWMLEEAPDHPFLVMVNERKKLHPDVDVHHIDRVRSNNARSNLLAVLKPAHALIHHKGKKPEPWECWPSNPIQW